jgi:hypothetical protein
MTASDDHALGLALWKQMGATIDMFDNALAACTGELWTGRLWADADPDSPPRYGEVWTVVTHAVRWLERYLLAVDESEFPTLASSTALTAFPEGGEPQTVQAVRDFLADLRAHARTHLTGLTDEEALRTIAAYEWIGPEPLPYLELQIYNIRHLQEHAAQIALFLGEHGVPGEKLDWVGRAG